MSKKVQKDNKPTTRANVNKPAKSSHLLQKSTVQAPPGSVSPAKPMPNYLIAAGVLALLIGGYLYNRYYAIAKVNGDSISRLAYYQALDRQYGRQVLDNLVTEKLINQEAAKANLVITQEQIDAEFEEIESSLQAQGQSLDDALLVEGLTRADLTQQIITKLQVESLGGSNTDVTQEDIDEFLEQNKDFLPEDITQEELEDLARDQLEAQSGNQNIQAWLDSVKASAQITYY